MTFRPLNLSHPYSIPRQSEKNVNWKGDKVRRAALHEWVRKRKPKPELCEECGVRNALDLANKTNLYLRELSDWEYLCRICHMTKDGRLKKLTYFAQARKKVKRVPCSICGEEYMQKHPHQRLCSKACRRILSSRLMTANHRRRRGLE